MRDEKHRGRIRLGEVTYLEVAEWTGLGVNTVRNHYGKQLRGMDLKEIIGWINKRRVKKGEGRLGE